MRMRVRISKDGKKTTVGVEGGEGTSCLEFTKALEQALGVVEHREMCPEADDPLTIEEKEDVQETGF